MRWLKDQRGTETIEFVILMPLTLFLIFGFMVYMFAIHAKIIVTDAAREGARVEALNIGPAEEKVKEVIKGCGLREDLIESVNVEVKDEGSTSYVSVQVVYKQPSIFPGLPQLIGNSSWPEYFRLTSKAVFKKEKL